MYWRNMAKSADARRIEKGDPIKTTHSRNIACGKVRSDSNIADVLVDYNNKYCGPRCSILMLDNSIPIPVNSSEYFNVILCSIVR